MITIATIAKYSYRNYKVVQFWIRLNLKLKERRIIASSCLRKKYCNFYKFKHIVAASKLTKKDKTVTTGKKKSEKKKQKREDRDRVYCVRSTYISSVVSVLTYAAHAWVMQ